MERILAAAAVSLLLVGQMAEAAGPPKRIVVLSEFRPGEPSVAAIETSLRAALVERLGGDLDYYGEYIANSSPDEDYRSALREFLRRKYASRPLDVVIPVGPLALEFVRDHGTDVFGGAPVVALIMAQSGRAMLEAWPGTPPATGLVDELDIKGTFDLILRLQPATRQVLIIGGASGNDASIEARARRQLAGHDDRVAVRYAVGLPLDKLLAESARLDPDTAVMFLQPTQDADGNPLVPDDVLPQLTAAANAPVYGVRSSQMDMGIVGGSVAVAEREGRELADLVMRVLRGERPQDIAIRETASIAPMVNWRALQRWQLTAATLPPNTIVLHKDRSLWERYRMLISTVTLVALQGAMIVALLLMRARRRDTEARNSALLNAVPDSMFLLTRDGVYVDYHAFNESQLLAKPSQFLGRHMRDVLPLDLALAFEERFAQLTQGQPPAILEYALPAPGGDRQYEARIVACNDDRVLAVVQDITDRKHGEAELRDSRERYARATAAGLVGVWDWDLEKNEIYVDPSLKARLGYENQDISTRVEDWMRLVHPDDAPAVAHASEGLGVNGPYEVEYRMVHRDGSVRWFLSRGAAVLRDGRPVRIVGTYTDITERKQAEQALHEAQADLARVSRLTALGEFAASITHEVSQPLTAMIANARTGLRWLADATPDVAELRALLLDVVAAGRRAEDVIQRNRELFRHRTVEKLPLDIHAVIAEAAIHAKARLQASRVTLTVSAGVDIPSVAGDRIGLQQVLLNLIANSIDAMETVDPALKRVEVSTSLAADGMVKVAVKDAGIGLAGVDLQRMFALSYTTKPAGTGVGLSISRAIVKAHGGELWAEQPEGPGATFSFTVPVTTEPAHA